MSQLQRCKVLRGFQHRREIQGPGTVLDLDVATANELRGANKVLFVHGETPRTHTDVLPDPNKVQALRAAQRAAATSLPATPAETAAASQSHPKEQPASKPTPGK